jgi:endonuclease/exonuclease/phosphatase family metal-dependent hydrolase
MPKSFREIAVEMDRLANPGGGFRLSALVDQHRWPADTPRSRRSLREVVLRHTDSDTIRFLSYNTFLTQAVIKMPGFIPDIRIKAKPALHQRAHEIGRRVRLDYDFVSLYEVMQTEQRDEILSNWDPAPLPENFYGGSLSSLFTISPKFRIGRREQQTYHSKGKFTGVKIVPVVGPTVDVSLDSDFYAEKGVMLTEILTPHGTIEVYSTHLFFGGGLDDAALLVNVLTPLNKHISESTPGERFNTQLAELAQLGDFYAVQHRPENVALICGDFNIDGADPVKFASMKRLIGGLGFKDAWAEGPFRNDLTGGYTTRNDDGNGPTQLDFEAICPVLPGNDDYCDDASRPATQLEFDGIGRYDYIFVQDPQPSHTANLDLTRIRRRQFRHHSDTGDQEFLSDHLGLETTLIVSRNLH